MGAVLGSLALAQTDKSKRPSPPEQASVSLNGKQITIDYSAPSMKGRKIMGGLVPYGHWWRTGANEATTLKTETNLRIGDATVPAGTYTLYSLPSESGWKLIINKQTGQWGTKYDESQDLARVIMMNGPKPSQPVERFAIRFASTGAGKTELHLVWENTDVYVPVTAGD
jgi:hypothetical protein